MPIAFAITDEDTISYVDSNVKKRQLLSVSLLKMSDSPWTLLEDEELRFEVAKKGDGIILELIEGMAEIFGTEMIQHKRYSFPCCARVAVFTWHGAVLELLGPTVSVYRARRTPMVIYLNTHVGLEQLRQQAEMNHTRGPRLMVTGPTDVGKSTVCRLLCNYAIRQGRTPTFVDLDVGQGVISVPGSIGCLYLERPADAVEGFDRKAPLVFNFGSANVGANITLYNLVVRQLANAVNERCKSIHEANIGGLVINTCGWVKDKGYTCLVKVAEAFEVDVVIVLDHERLYNDLMRDLPAFVKTQHQPKSGGVEDRSRETRIASRHAAIRRYFYGNRLQPYCPHSFDIGWDDVELVKIGADKLPASCLPFGVAPQDDRTTVVALDWDSPSLLLHHLLAVSMADRADSSVTTNAVAGYVCVLGMNTTKRTATLLAPQPRPLPRRVLVWSDITFVDS